MLCVSLADTSVPDGSDAELRAALHDPDRPARLRLRGVRGGDGDGAPRGRRVRGRPVPGRRALGPRRGPAGRAAREDPVRLDAGHLAQAGAARGHRRERAPLQVPRVQDE